MREIFWVIGVVFGWEMGFETVADGAVAYGSSHAFSLTLTLSRWERGQPLDACLKSASQRAGVSREFAVAAGRMPDKSGLQPGG
jgi:hypothetical protein